jgi:hypothetical protein
MIRQFINAGMKMLASLVLVTQMTACGPGDDSGNASSAASDVVISGSVGDGPITGATVITYNAQGKELGSVTSGIYATYNSKMKIKGRDYPLTMEVVDGTDLVTGAAPDFRLLSVAISRKEKNVNINPFSTLVVKIAQLMPDGINAKNINTAKNYVTSQMGFGLDLNVVEDPITTSINDSNVANIVKASEAMGEMIRRTRDTVSMTGSAISGDDVMDAIAADMTNGYLDGIGSPGTSASISAVANVVAGQVLVEAMSNTLKVGGAVATGLIDLAIELTHTNIDPSRLTGNVRITGGMLKQARTAVKAARVLDSSSHVTAIANSLEGINPEILPDVVASELPADSSAALANAVILSSTASETEAALINQAVHADGTASDTGSAGGTDAGGTDAGGTDTGGTDTGGTDTGGTDTGGTDTGGTDTGGTDTGGTGTADPGATAILQAAWSLLSVDSEELVDENGAAVNAFDGDPATLWVTQWSDADPVHPHEIRIDLGGSYTVSGLQYLPRQDNGDNGRIRDYEFYVSTDGNNWGSPVATGSFPDNSAEQEVRFTAMKAAAVRLVALSSYDGDPWTAVAEINVLGEFAGNDESSDSGSGGSTGGSGSGGTGADTGGSGSSDTGSGSGDSGSGTGDSGSGTGDGGSGSGDGGSDLPVNTAPTIKGTPAASVSANDNYSFQPVATDTDGNLLAFSIANKPYWAEFSDTTGRLSGPVTNADADTYDNILISVTDGLETVSLPAFSIRVDAVPAPTGSFTLNWTAPVARSDGSPLSLAEIDGYRIYYENASGDSPNSQNVTDGSADSATVTDVPAGDYNVVMTTYDDAGRESAVSAQITKTAQ